MGHVDKIRFGVVSNNLDGIQNPLTIGTIQPLAWFIQN
jgi:hypothetical protein